MKVEVEIEEMIQIMDNVLQIGQSFEGVGVAAEVGDVQRLLKDLTKALQLTRQAVKSIHAIMHEIRIRELGLNPWEQPSDV